MGRGPPYLLYCEGVRKNEQRGRVQKGLFVPDPIEKQKVPGSRDCPPNCAADPSTMHFSAVGWIRHALGGLYPFKNCARQDFPPLKLRRVCPLAENLQPGPDRTVKVLPRPSLRIKRRDSAPPPQSILVQLDGPRHALWRALSF